MSGYIGPIPVPQGIQEKQSFTATASQTTFNTNGYTDGAFINVYLNGVRLINGTDYTATNGSDIVLTTGASASDVLDFETFNSFSLVDQTFDNVTLKNPTHEDTDGGRESAVSFKGEQSGGEISTLAQIQASHDGTSDDQKGDLIFKTNDGSDNDAPTEAARIDSSRNVLIGKTAVGSTSGIELRGSIGYSSFTRDGNFPVTARRLTDDGDIIQFEKDTTVVGSIGTRAGRIKIGDGDVGLFFDNSNNRINPEGPSDSSAIDNAIDLGGATQRFKDLYLSGGAYLGGTTSANFLDDYEEGNWTADVTVGTVSNVSQATYTKIGNVVHVQCKLNSFSNSTSSDSLAITGMPYPGYAADISAIATSALSKNISGTNDINVYFPTTTSIYLYGSITGGEFDNLKYSDLSSGMILYLGFSYFAA